jgi:hypothetical protein
MSLFFNPFNDLFENSFDTLLFDPNGQSEYESVIDVDDDVSIVEPCHPEPLGTLVASPL